MSKKTVKDIDLKDKKVLVRCDFNVPMDENKKIPTCLHSRDLNLALT